MVGDARRWVDPLVLPHKDKSRLVADEHYKSVEQVAGYFGLGLKHFAVN